MFNLLALLDIRVLVAYNIAASDLPCSQDVLFSI